MSDQLTNMGGKSRKSKCIKWVNEENYSKPSPPSQLNLLGGQLSLEDYRVLSKPLQN